MLFVSLYKYSQVCFGKLKILIDTFDDYELLPSKFWNGDKHIRQLNEYRGRRAYYLIVQHSCLVLEYVWGDQGYEQR